MYSAHYTQPLLSLANTQLDGLDALLNPPFTASAIRDVLTLLQDDDGVLRTEQQRQVVFAKIAFGLYSHALDLYLDEASAAQRDAEWWAEVEQSNQLAALYLLQSNYKVSVPRDRPTLTTLASVPETYFEPVTRLAIQRWFTSLVNVSSLFSPRPTLLVPRSFAAQPVPVHLLSALEEQSLGHADAVQWSRSPCRPTRFCLYDSFHSAQYRPTTRKRSDVCALFPAFPRARRVSSEVAGEREATKRQSGSAWSE